MSTVLNREATVPRVQLPGSLVYQYFLLMQLSLTYNYIYFALFI